MYKTLKRTSFRAILPGFVITLLCAVIALAAAAPCLAALSGRASELDASVTAGKAVRFDSMMVVAGFASASNASGETVRTYYMIDLGGGKFMAMEASPKYDGALSGALKQSEGYYHTHTIDSLSPMGEISGTAADMDDETYDFLRQGLDSAGLDGEIVPITVVLGKVGYLSDTAFTVILCIGLVMLAAAAAELALAFSGIWQKKARDFAESLYSPEETAEDFENAEVFDHVHLGDKLLWYQLGPRTQCAAVSELLWGFDRIDGRVLGSRRYSLYLYDSNGVCHDIRTKTEEERRPIADAVAEKGYPFIFGYSQERAGLFARDRAAFRRMAEAEIRK